LNTSLLTANGLSGLPGALTPGTRNHNGLPSQVMKFKKSQPIIQFTSIYFNHLNFFERSE